jgi:hypothetical protein
VKVFFKTRSWRNLRRDKVFTVVEENHKRLVSSSIEGTCSKFVLQAGKFCEEILG